MISFDLIISWCFVQYTRDRLIIIAEHTYKIVSVYLELDGFPWGNDWPMAYFRSVFHVVLLVISERNYPELKTVYDSWTIVNYFEISFQLLWEKVSETRSTISHCSAFMFKNGRT